MLRCKMTVTSGDLVDSGNGTEEHIVLKATSWSIAHPASPGGSTVIDEILDAAKINPTAQLEIRIQSPLELGTVSLGDEFFVDFTRVR